MENPSPVNRILQKENYLTPPVISLLSANLVTIVLAIAGAWDAATILFIYWAQSIIIGIFTVVSILSADAVSISAAMNRSRAESGEHGTVMPARVRIQAGILAAFFIVHYGIFHGAYYTFVVESGLFGVVDFTNPGTGYSCGLFFINHLFSYLYYRNRVQQDEHFMMDTFTRPYHRIFPMHFTIIFGVIVIALFEVAGITSTLPVLVLFLLFKTAADLVMHREKHPFRQERRISSGQGP